LIGSASSINDSSSTASSSGQGYDTKAEDENLSSLYKKWNSSVPALAWSGLIGLAALASFLLFQLVKRRAAKKYAASNCTASADSNEGGGKKQRGHSAGFTLEGNSGSLANSSSQDTMNPVLAVSRNKDICRLKCYQGIFLISAGMIRSPLASVVSTPHSWTALSPTRTKNCTEDHARRVLTGPKPTH